MISMPDSWEYPWFAAWDLAFHCGALALIDVDFAKDQIELMLSDRYLHPNGQIPAYEWNFSDVNPPVHALGALKAFRAERVQRGEGDRGFLQRVFHKLLLNYAWWINRKDADGHNVFEGGFLGLDNISVVDRSQPLPPGYSLKQADATGWVAMFALNMTVMALELAIEDRDYENIAMQTYEQFLAIANAIGGHADGGVSLWDPDAGFFKDLICTPDGQYHRIDVYSMVGLIPLFATEVIDRRLLANVPRFRERLRRHKGGAFQGNYVCACPDWENERGEHLLAMVDHTMLPRILSHLLSENEFLSSYGVRSVSRVHAEHRDLGVLPGIGQAMIEYVPGEFELAAVRRQLQLARADLDAGELHADPGDREVPPLPRRRLQGRGTVPGRTRAQSQGDRDVDRRAHRRHLSAGSAGTHSGVADAAAVRHRRTLEGPAAVLRILPRRYRTGLGRGTSDRMDRTDRQPGDASLSQGHPAVLAQGDPEPSGRRVSPDSAGP